MSKTITKFITEFRKEEVMEDKTDAPDYGMYGWAQRPVTREQMEKEIEERIQASKDKPSHLDMLKKAAQHMSQYRIPETDSPDYRLYLMMADGSIRPMPIGGVYIKNGRLEVVSVLDEDTYPDAIPDDVLDAHRVRALGKEAVSAIDQCLEKASKRVYDGITKDVFDELTPLPPSTQPLIVGEVPSPDWNPYAGKEPDPIPADELERIEKLLDDCAKPLRDINPAAGKAWEIRKAAEIDKHAEVDRIRKEFEGVWEAQKTREIERGQANDMEKLKRIRKLKAKILSPAEAISLPTVEQWAIQQAIAAAVRFEESTAGRSKEMPKAKSETFKFRRPTTFSANLPLAETGQQAVFVITEAGLLAVVPKPRPTDRIIPEEEITDEMRKFRAGVLSRAQPIGAPTTKIEKANERLMSIPFPSEEPEDQEKATELKNRAETERAKKLLDECYQPVDFDPSQVKAWGIHHAADQTLTEVTRIRAEMEATLRAKAGEPQWKPVVHVITKDGLPAIVSETRDTDRVISEEEFIEKIRKLKGGMPFLAKPIRLPANVKRVHIWLGADMARGTTVACPDPIPDDVLDAHRKQAIGEDAVSTVWDKALDRCLETAGRAMYKAITEDSDPVVTDGDPVLAAEDKPDESDEEWIQHFQEALDEKKDEPFDEFDKLFDGAKFKKR